MKVFCQVTYNEDAENTRICIQNIHPYVDRIVIIEDGTLPVETREWLKKMNCEVYTYPWMDSTSIQRNHYLEKLEDGDWAIVSDPDEQFNYEFCRDIGKLIKEAEDKGCNMLQINVHDVWLKKDGSQEEIPGDFYKNLIFKYHKGVHYEGQIHETLKPASQHPWKVLRLPPTYFYRHIKTEWMIWRNGTRNCFCAGCGDNLMERNPYWVELRAICSAIGIENWKQFNAYLQKGNIDRRLKEWILRYGKLDSETWHSELRDVYHYYFDYLHSEEKPEKEEVKVTHWHRQPPVIIKGGLSEFTMKLRELYRRVLGREPSRCEIEYFWGEKTNLEELEEKLKNPENIPVAVYIAQQYWDILKREVDSNGFQTYLTLINLGKIKRETLPQILKQSTLKGENK